MKKNGLIYDVHEKPPVGKNFLYAFQQVLAILAATVLVPILVDQGTGRMSQAAALIGAGVGTFALQALICFVTAAFCNLLWTRVINVMLLSASKNKYNYFRFVREEDDDDE